MNTENRRMPQYITNHEGERVSVILPIEEYESLMEDIDDLATIAQRKTEFSVPHEEFLSELKEDGLL